MAVRESYRLVLYCTYHWIYYVLHRRTLYLLVYASNNRN